MPAYKNLSGHSGVLAYKISSDRITVLFKGGHEYSYSYAKAGKAHVEAMKKLAKAGRGLSSYISRHVHKLYD